nr:lamin tail domain-containing protein [Candidatus Delongbacteria bacterium]
YLLTKDKTALDSISYVNFNEDDDRSIEKISPELNSFDLDNWKYCTQFGTPTQRNSISPQDHDLELSLVNIPDNIQINTDFQINLKVRNLGLNTSDGFRCNALIDEEIYSFYEHNFSILPNDSAIFSLTMNLENSGTDTLTFDLETNIDDNYINNVIRVLVYVVYNERCIVLNEFMKYPDDSQCEWIEVVNISEDSLNLGDFSITDSNKDVLIPFPSIVLQPNDFYVIAENDLIYDFPTAIHEKITINGSFPALNNDSDCIYIFDKLNSTVDSILYADFDDDNGISIEKINPEFNSSMLSNWVYSVSTATPTIKNSVYQDPSDNNNENNFSLYPKTVTPNDDGNNDNLIISYDFDSAYIYLTVKIYNIKGQQVAIPANSVYTSSKNDFVWNCKDNKGITVNTGAYICFLNVKNSDGKIIKLKEVFYLTK